MKFDRTGIILYVENYPKCVEFYKDLVGLSILFKTDFLTCFEFGDSYLMVEPTDDEIEKGKNGRDKTCLRMNVENVKKLSDKLKSKRIEVNYQEHDWGTIAKFYDPDGNLCAFKDSEKFEAQINEYKTKNM